MVRVKMVYKKSNGSFITIVAEYLREDKNFMYLKCGKYKLENIVASVKLYDSSDKEDLSDDA